MAVQPFGADTTTGKLPDVVEARVTEVVEDAGFVAVDGSNNLPAPVQTRLTEVYDSRYEFRGAGVESIANLPRPVVMAHRSAGMLAPENSMAAIRFAASLPTVHLVDAGDVRSTKDGALILNHDQTLDARTSLTGNVSDWPLAGLMRSNIIDASAWFGGGWQDQPVCTVEQMFAEVGGKSYMAVEPKDTNAINRLLEIIGRMGIGPSVMFTHASPTTAALAKPLGCLCATFRSAAQMSTLNVSTFVAEMNSVGIIDVQVEHGSDMAKIDALIAAGLRVSVYNLFRHHEVALYAGKDIFGYIVDDPSYTPNATNPSLYRRTTASWPLTGTWGPGMLNTGNNNDVTMRGKFIGTGPGSYRWQPNTDTAFLLIGELCPIANPTNYTLNVPITFDSLGSDPTKWAAVFFAGPTDIPHVGQPGAGRNGYNVLLRANGDAALYRVTDGNATQLGSVSVAPDLAEGATVTLSIAVTPTAVNITRSDGGPAITTTDTTYRGGYFHFGMLGHPQGLRVSYGAVNVA